MRSPVVGDPMQEATQIDPLATEQSRRDIEEQVDDARQQRSRILCGVARSAGEGWLYEPTAISEIPESARVYGEEVFGPVALFFRVASADDAIRLANDCVFGLGSSVWTNDEEEAVRFIRETKRACPSSTRWWRRIRACRSEA